jgi:hypothetical protein
VGFSFSSLAAPQKQYFFPTKVTGVRYTTKLLVKMATVVESAAKRWYRRKGK